MLRQQAGLGRLPAKLVDALEPLVLSAGRASRRSRAGSRSGRRAAEAARRARTTRRQVERRLTVVAAQPAGGLALSLCS